jgi:hypothetical protein
MMALAAAGAVAFAGSANAADIGVTGLKLIVLDKLAAASKAKAVFVVKDPGIDKGTGTDAATISGNMRVTYDSSAGQWDMPSGAGWLVNKSSVAKYVNKQAPTGGNVKVSVIKPGTLFKVVGKGLGDGPVLDISSAPTGSVLVAANVTNGAESNSHCTSFNACVHKVIAGGGNFKLICKGSATPDGACGANGPPPVLTVLNFTTGAAGGTCGESRTGGSAGTILNTLTCGGLNIGGGNSTVPEGPTPAGATTLFNASCSGGSCAITARTAAQTGSGNNCSDTGCAFGPFLSIANGGLSTCVRNTFAAPGSGSITTPGGAFSGGVPLTSTVTVTGNAANPCPSCIAGACDPSATVPGGACTATNGAGDTHDCLPVGVGLAPFPVSLVPIGTGTQSDTGPTFCPGQDATAPGLNGCFADPSCDYIEERGADASGISVGGGSVSGTLASVFCIPATGNGLIDGAADLPGPGATSLPGTLELL